MENAVIITRIIDGGATLPSTPAAERDFHNTCFIYKGSKKGSNRINYVGTDTSAIIDTYGSNSEVLKAAQTFLAGGFLGNSPKELYVGNIDTTSFNLEAGEAVYSSEDNAFVISGSARDKFSSTDLTYAVFTISGEQVPAYCMYTNAEDYKLKLYATRNDAVSGNAIAISLSDSDATSTAVISSENFADALNEILNNSTIYHLIVDNTFTDEEKKIIISSVESSATSHFVFVLDTNNSAKYEDKDRDTTSILHFATNAKYSKCLIVVEDEAKKDEYKQASACSYYAQVNWTTSSPMGSLMFKTMSGITPSEFNENPLVQTTSAYDNVIAKNGNCYVNFTNVEAPAWAKGVAANGSQAGDIIAKDFVLFQCDYQLFYMLQGLPKLPINQGGATKIEHTMAIALSKLTDAGVIGAGVAEDGTSFGPSGFIVFAKVPTGTDKAQGIWKDVKAEALLTGTTTKITYQIQFKN